MDRFTSKVSISKDKPSWGPFFLHNFCKQRCHTIDIVQETVLHIAFTYPAVLVTNDVDLPQRKFLGTSSMYLSIVCLNEVSVIDLRFSFVFQPEHLLTIDSWIFMLLPSKVEGIMFINQLKLLRRWSGLFLNQLLLIGLCQREKEK